MINYYRGFRRIWIVLWFISSSVGLFFGCLILEPNPALPLANIHPNGAKEPVVDPFEESNIPKDNTNEYKDWHYKLKKLNHEEQVQARSKWAAELISAFRIHTYWKNVGITLLALGAWTALLWCLWAAGVWIVRGFTSKT